MGPKHTGYEFWKSVLKSPQYIAAPMVDMSELSFRMLCRRYKSQLCFSPMLHSQQFMQDSLYRLDTFSTCPEDRPLIVQFCSNDPNDFVNAAMLVSSKCDAVDLNLGCPQAIARKGNYGAFLQDDWNLIHSIVRKASQDLAVPVTCKMRILPGDIRNSVHYAKMLEGAGCSVITVHGRTRDQKGHATGLASWEAIKEIKASVSIPVIANGNVLSFADVKECLKYTGADAVMSAEAILHNPALFSGKNPPVWKIVQEYLKYAEQCNTPLRCVRCHLFKILYLCIHQDDSVQQILAEGKSYADFYSVCDILKNLSKFCQKTSKQKEPDVDYYLTGKDLNLHESLDDSDVNESSSSSGTVLANGLHSDLTLRSGFDSMSSRHNPKSMSDNTHSVAQNTKNEPEESSVKSEMHLPVWLCHSRPRLVDSDDNKSRGCYSKYFTSLPQKLYSERQETEKDYMSKKKLRRAKHHERTLAAMKDKRRTKKMRRKLKFAEERQRHIHENANAVESENKAKITKKEKKMLARKRLLDAQGHSPKVCINLGFASEMDTKELTRLSSQLRRLYGSNKQSSFPFHLHFCNLSELDDLYKICLAKNDGFSSYVVEMTEKSPEELFQPQDLIYLSPDSENPLTCVDPNKVYVIGGIVDGTVRKDLSLNHAKEFNIESARLPIPEHLVKCSQNPGTTVLTVNQVFDILLKYYEMGDWVEALSSNVPQRKGYCAPDQVTECTIVSSLSKS